jgi:hypothetical protein
MQESGEKTNSMKAEMIFSSMLTCLYEQSSYAIEGHDQEQLSLIVL